MPLEGGFAVVGQQTKLGVEACFRAVNDAGGLNGRKLKLLAHNDGYEPVPCVQNTLKLIDEDKVFALCSYVGTPTSVKARKVWQSKSVPVVGFYTGAGARRPPFNACNIHVRASYAREAGAIVDAFVKDAGASKIAIFYQADAFGEAVKSVTEAALAKANLKPVVLGSFERNTLDIEKGLGDIKSALQVARSARHLCRFSVRRPSRSNISASPGYASKSSRTFAWMSPCFTSDSPTRMAPAPHFATRATSAGVWMPLSATSRGESSGPRVVKSLAANLSVVARSTLKDFKSRLFTPIKSAPIFKARSSSASS